MIAGAKSGDIRTASQETLHRAGSRRLCRYLKY